MDYVEVSILDELETEDDDVMIPPCLSFHAWKKKEDFMHIDFGEVEQIEVE